MCSHVSFLSKKLKSLDNVVKFLIMTPSILLGLATLTAGMNWALNMPWVKDDTIGDFQKKTIDKNNLDCLKNECSTFCYIKSN